MSTHTSAKQPGRFHIICQHGTRVLMYDQTQDRFSVITFPAAWPNSHDNLEDAMGEFNSYLAE